MSFNLDDPLAGILSDGSDDSFFDDDVMGTKKPAMKKSTPVAEKKNALFDLDDDGDKTDSKISQNKKESLFDLGPSDSKKVTVVDDVNTYKNDLSKSPSFKKAPSKESIQIQSTDSKKLVFDKLDVTKSPAKTEISSSTDKLNLLGELTMETKKEPFKPLEKGKSSQSLLDDILGGSSKKIGGSSQPTRPATAAKSQEFDFDSILGKKEGKPTQKIQQKQSAKVENTKDEKVTKKSKSSEDWLGIFEDKEENIAEEDDGMPAWLVGDAKKKKPEETVKKSKEVTVQELPTKPKEQDYAEVADITRLEAKIETQFENVMKPAASLSVFQGSSEDITAEGAALYLQQQESQLMVALQLKAQEEKLATMQMRQKETQRVQREASLAHHAQLDAMLQRQADQRQQMQAVIAEHQERITKRIKALLGTSNIDNDEYNNNLDNEEYGNNSIEKKESPKSKEKKQLLQLVQSLQENHDKEIDLMETSYRRQLAFLELSVSQSEERMKEESEKLFKFYSEKISWLDEHHMLYKKLTEDNLNSLAERHKAENEMLRQQHLDNVRVLQEHHAALMENIKNAVKQEQVLIQDSAGFSSDLHHLVSDVKESRSQFELLVEKVQTFTENTQRDTERSLQTRETQINDMIQQLKKERENFEVEKNESRDMVKMLETRLKQMTTMIEEETASLKQKKMEFEFEKATFSKQTEFAKNILKKQDEEIKMLKEDIQKEYQEKISKIDEEKSKALKDSAAVAKEKASIQSLKQELEKTKVELHAQLEEIMEERTKLNLEKQQMHMEEQRILAKRRDLDLLAKSAIEKQSQADKKYSEAEFIQRKYEDRIRRMQEHVVSLNAREKQIAKEKVALSRERLNLHNDRKQIESRLPCSLCKSSQNVPGYNLDDHSLHDTYLNVPVSRDYGNSNMNSAMNAIEQEMAHLMSRNFSLRHTTPGIVSLSGHDERTHERVPDSFHATQSPQVEPGAFKDYMDPKFMMLRLDVQQVLSNLDHNKKDDDDEDNEENSEE